MLAALVATGLCAGRVDGQEPPAHIAICGADSAARAFLDRMRYLVATLDSAERTGLALGAIAPGDVALVLEEPLCLAASQAYAARSRRSGTLTPPFPVAVVRAGDRLLVQLGGLSGRESEGWEVMVFDLMLRPVGPP